MISDKEFLEVIQGLYQKTCKENFKWDSLSLRVGYSVPPPPVFLASGRGTEDEAFWARLPKSVVFLQYGRPSAEPDFIVFTLARDLSGPALATRKVYEGDIGWDTLYDLYALIKRRELGWDDVFKGVREFLGNAKTPAAS